MFKPLRDLVLIEQEEIVQEETRASGLILLKSSFNLYGWDDEDTRARDIIQRKKQNRGKIIACGNKCTFFKPGDTVIYKKQTEAKRVIYNDKECVLVSEEHILVKETESGQICHPDNLIIKISRESRDSVFTKKIKRDDGSYTELFMYNPTMGKDDESHAKHFVASGVVMAVGKGISNVQVGDIAILDYMVDNDDDIIVGYDGYDKLIVTSSKTKYVDREEWVYANRFTEQDRKKKSFGQPLCPHDIQVARPGDYEIMAPVLGVLRGDELISFDPYVFLVHEETLVTKITPFGILYSENEKILTRKVLTSSIESEKRLGIKSESDVVVDDFDVFDVYFEGKRISCINDIDVIMVK